MKNLEETEQWKLFTYLRNLSYEIEYETESDIIKKAEDISKKLKIKKENLWWSEAFHFSHRITNLNDIGLKNNEERDISILPLNFLLGEPTINKFIPDLINYEETHILDPYGLLANSVIVDGENVGIHKFPYAVLDNKISDCIVGCADCYKGEFTRLNKIGLGNINNEIKEYKFSLNKRRLEKSKKLAKYITEHPEITTVVISGGEPLMISESTLEKIMDNYANIPSLKVLRICTAAVYNGAFFMLKDKIKALAKGRGIQVYLNAHVTNAEQMSTYEAKEAVKIIKDAGLSVHLQMPLQQGVNFFREDLQKSKEILLKVTEKAYETGVDPYKLIVDMHSTKHPSKTIPINFVKKVISEYDLHNVSDMSRFRVVNILNKEGNSYIYPI